MVRLKAILYAIKYAILPYWLYERRKHYDCSYFEHFAINVKYMLRWATFSELESDVEFERDVNKNK